MLSLPPTIDDDVSPLIKLFSPPPRTTLVEWVIVFALPEPKIAELERITLLPTPLISDDELDVSSISLFEPAPIIDCVDAVIIFCKPETIDDVCDLPIVLS